MLTVKTHFAPDKHLSNVNKSNSSVHLKPKVHTTSLLPSRKSLPGDRHQVGPQNLPIFTHHSAPFSSTACPFLKSSNPSARFSRISSTSLSQILNTFLSPVLSM